MCFGPGALCDLLDVLRSVLTSHLRLEPRSVPSAAAQHSSRNRIPLKLKGNEDEETVVAWETVSFGSAAVALGRLQLLLAHRSRAAQQSDRALPRTRLQSLCTLSQILCYKFSPGVCSLQPHSYHHVGATPRSRCIPRAASCGPQPIVLVSA